MGRDRPSDLSAPYPSAPPTPPPRVDYYTLRALALEWDALFSGAVLEDAWTQSPRELSLALEDRDGAAHTVRVACDPALPLLFRSAGTGRQRRNTADVLPAVAGRAVVGVRVADRDRHVFVVLEGGSRLQVVLFGPRPNVFWAQDGVVRDAFLDHDEWAGEPAPAPRPAPVVADLEAFRARWPARKTAGQATASAAPLLTRPLADQALRRAGLDPDAPPSGLALEDVFEAVARFEADLLSPDPHVYWRGPVAQAFALVPLADAGDWRAEPFGTVDAALSVWSKRALAQRAYTSAYGPLEKALAGAAGRRERSAEAMLEELSQPSRADGYETQAHLLMALEAGAGPGRESVVVEDIMGDGDEVEIPLDPALSAVENAERFYDKARKTRGARAAAEARWASAWEQAETAADLLARVRATASLADLRALEDQAGDEIAAVVGQKGGGGPVEPFRRVPLPGGFEALVGKHARGNAHLTTRVASPHDLWLHARGVPGSHVVVKRPGRSTDVPRPALEAAARLAAWFSTARTQSVVPVTVTERKYVRPVKGGPPGLVRVDREDVLDVVPTAP